MTNEKRINFIHQFSKILLIIFFISFLTLYLSKNSGYFEYQQYKKTSFTKEQIQQFEQDIRDGKNIDINNYLENEDKDYSNKMSNLGLFLSKKMEKFIKLSMDKMVKYLNGAMS